MLLIVICAVASQHSPPVSVSAQGPNPGGGGAPVPADGIFSRSTSAHANVKLRLTVGSLPADMAVGCSVELYLEDDFQVPDAVGSSSVYFVLANPTSRQTGSGARIYAAIAAVIRDGPHLGGNHDWSLQVTIPDLCTSPANECAGPNGPMQGQTLTMVIDDDAGIKNPSEAGSYRVGYSLLGPADDGNRGPDFLLEDLPINAKISLSDADNRRGYALTVTGSGFNDGTAAAVYVLHDPGVGADAFDNGANEAALCERIVQWGTQVGGAPVSSDDRVSVTFKVAAPTFAPGNANYICMVDGEGRMSQTDVERFHLEPSIRVSPSTVRAGDAATIFAHDFPNAGAGFTELKLAGRTAAASVTSWSFISGDASATATFTVPDDLVGAVSVEAAWGETSASASLTIVDPDQSPVPEPGYPPPATNIAMRDGSQPGEVVIAWDAVPEATHYRIGYVNMVADYPLAKASQTGNWLEAFVYVDMEAQNFTVVGGRTEYTIRRLAQGVRHAFTVRTGNSPYGDYTWPSNPHWKFHTVADRGGACPTADTAQSNTEPASPGQSTPTDYLDQLWDRSWSGPSRSQRAIQWAGTHWNIAAVVSGGAVPRAGITVAPTGDIAVRDGSQPGEVVIAWDAVPEATHYRIGYVNMVADYPLAKASQTGNWLEAFVYVDMEAQNFTVVGGRTEYTIRRLAQGVRHAFTVRTGNSPYGDYTWPSNPRWKFHTVADRSGSCPSVSPMPDPTFETERAALAALYEATGGAHWSNNTNWLSEKPVGDWYGVATDDAGRVIHVHLPTNQLSGSIPSQLANLASLWSLQIGGNELSGPIPPQLGNLASLGHLHLDGNELSGSIPPQLANLVNLEYLELGGNEFSGCVPRELRDVRLHGVSLPVCDGALVCTVHTTTDGIFAEAKWSDVPTELNGNPLTGYEVVWTVSGIGGTRSEPLVRLGKSHTQTSLTVPGAATTQAVQFSLRGVYIQQSGEYIHESCVDHQLERATLVSLYIATGGESWTYDHNWLSHQEVGAWSGVRTGHNGRVIGLSFHYRGLSGELPKSLANSSCSRVCAST